MGHWGDLKGTPKGMKDWVQARGRWSEFLGCSALSWDSMGWGVGRCECCCSQSSDRQVEG